jgi:hypothetical protein
MISLLAGQLVVLKASGFQRLHPRASAWLVWEPGSWLSPRSELESNTGVTRFPLTSQPEAPEDGDALCFELCPDEQGDDRLKIGRATYCDIILNDMTVSREQFELHHCEGFWAALSSVGATTFVGEVEASRAIALRDHTAIRAGGLRLSFYRPAGFLERLRCAF